MDEWNTTARPEGAPTAPPRSARWPVVLAAGLLALGAVGTFLVWKRTGTGVQPMLEPAPAASPAEQAPPGPTMTSAESDALLRQRLAGLSGEPEWAAWLKEVDLLRRFTSVVAAMADGESPRALVGFLAPRGSFQVRERGGRTRVDPAGYARYGAIERVLGSLDAAALVTVYREVEPVAEALYREGARPGSTFRDALGRAFDRILSVPVLEGDVEVVARGAVYVYADPALEGLTPAEKHLLRMGPGVVRTLQQKVRAVATALDVPLARR